MQAPTRRRLRRLKLPKTLAQASVVLGCSTTTLAAVEQGLRHSPDLLARLDRYLAECEAAQRRERERVPA